MKTIFTIAAIAMFAVTLGLGLMSPALASQPDENGKHKVELCHYQEAKTTDRFGNELEIPIPEAYLPIEVDNKGKMNGHFKHGVAHHFPADEFGVPLPDENGDPRQGDFVITNDDEVNNPTDENDSVADCEALDAALGD